MPIKLIKEENQMSRLDIIIKIIETLLTILKFIKNKMS